MSRRYKKMKLKPKNENCFWHTKFRLKERYDIDIDESKYKKLLKQISCFNSGPTFVAKLSNSRYIHMINIDGKDVPMVYNSQKKIFHTALPPNFDVDELIDKYQYINNPDYVPLSKRKTDAT